MMYFNVVSKLDFHKFYNNLDNLINNEIGLKLLLDNSNPAQIWKSESRSQFWKRPEIPPFTQIWQM